MRRRAAGVYGRIGEPTGRDVIPAPAWKQLRLLGVLPTIAVHDVLNGMSACGLFSD